MTLTKIRSYTLGAALASILSGLSAATAFISSTFDNQSALGEPLFALNGQTFYAPWAFLVWIDRWGGLYPKPFAVGWLIVLAGVGIAGLIISFSASAKRGVKPFGRAAWGGLADVKSAGLLRDHGAVLGKLDGELLCYDGQGHQILIGASRSGKGRGHVVPTLLAWPFSALVLDVKNELADGDLNVGFAGTAGFREQIGPVLRFAPTSKESACFNPLFEVRRGANEVRDVQNIIEILVDPQGDGRHQDFWDRSAKNILVGVILHVLYTEQVERKTLAVVREKLRDLHATTEAMRSTLHRLNPLTNKPEVHPEVLHAAESFLAGEERLQSGVKSTAESFFGLFADELVARNTATSDFRIGDLMCGDRPMTLFLQPPPSDAIRLTPLMRLLINQVARSLMEDQTADAQGRVKNHRLLLLLDEFPMLGRMPFFETMMGGMAGFGLRAFLVCQSLNHVTKAYGRDNVILDNCHIVTSFAAADGDTAKRIADMAGEVWELRESETRRRPAPIFGTRHGSTTIREERRPLLLPADVRALPRDEQLIFVSGAKPIRAKKIRFDEERVFVARLRPASNERARLPIAHDWKDVRALGTMPQQAKPKAKPAMSKPLADQPDLFAQAAARAAAPAKISGRAMAGFRSPDGAPLPHPATIVAAGPNGGAPTAIPSVAPRVRRAKGI